jgi:hypothetical protein
LLFVLEANQEEFVGSPRTGTYDLVHIKPQELTVILREDKKTLEYVSQPDPMLSMLEWLCDWLIKRKYPRKTLQINQSIPLSVTATVPVIAHAGLIRTWIQSI